MFGGEQDGFPRFFEFANQEIHFSPLLMTQGVVGLQYERSLEVFQSAVVLALQSIVNPFGIFGARAMVVAETGWLNIWLGFSGLVSAVLIALLILALRRRFKMR